jgi:hypothetical protein
MVVLLSLDSSIYTKTYADMKRAFTLILALVAAAAVNAQNLSNATNTTTTATTVTSTAAVAKPVPENILVLKETEFDFGKIPQGKPVTHIFDVANKSNEILKISNVTASCGCTTPVWDKDKPVDPGNATKITVGYNAAAEGPFTKQITVSYNEGQVKVITIKGEVWKTPVASAPENKSINDLKN